MSSSSLSLENPELLLNHNGNQHISTSSHQAGQIDKKIDKTKKLSLQDKLRFLT
jgi:hypothetical protein